MKLVIGLSGGLDSTFAAYLLKKAGHEVTGAVLKMHGASPLAEAAQAAEQVGIPLTVLDCTERFERCVVRPFAEEYRLARTPNPCVNCNAQVKFAALLAFAEEQGADGIATGHYARVLCEGGRYFIRRSDEGGKDQSYVLWRLEQRILSSLILPLSGRKKNEVREEARSLGFTAAEAKESMENCFIPDDDYAGFLEKRYGISPPPGEFVDTAGNRLGTHRGIVRYTVGQRKGLGIALGAPAYVTRIDPAANTVTLGTAQDLMTGSLTADRLAFQKLPPAEGEYRLTCKIRYAAPPVPCTVRIGEDRIALVRFDTPVRAVTPGQSAVFYDGEDVAMGGFIC